jgi:hypothetical protein
MTTREIFPFLPKVSFLSLSQSNRPKSFVASKGYLGVITTKIPVNRRARQMEGAMTWLQDNVEGVDPWSLSPDF